MVLLCKFSAWMGTTLFPHQGASKIRTSKPAKCWYYSGRLNKNLKVGGGDHSFEDYCAYQNYIGEVYNMVILCKIFSLDAYILFPRRCKSETQKEGKLVHQIVRPDFLRIESWERVFRNFNAYSIWFFFCYHFILLGKAWDKICLTFHSSP